MSLRHVSNNLYVGDTLAPDIDGADVIITLEATEHPQTDFHIPIVDDPSFDEESFERAVNVAVTQLLHGQRVLVHCTSGVNRSPAVAAAAHCILTDDGAGQSITKAQCGSMSIAPYFRPAIESVCSESTS